MAGSAQQKAFPGFKLDLSSGVPVYRQIIDQVTGGMAAGFLKPGDQLPTVRQLAVDLAVNPNTVVRAYRELEIRGILETQQGTGTFIGNQKPDAAAPLERQRLLNQLASEFVAKAGAAGYTVPELIAQLQDLNADNSVSKKGKR